MKKKLFSIMAVGLFSLTLGFEVYSQCQPKKLEPADGAGKALAQYVGSGEYCCADKENNSCNQSPDC